MFNMHKRGSLENVCYNENILKFTGISVYLTSKVMFRYYNDDVPYVFQNIFVLNVNDNQHHTRQNGYYHVPCVKNNR